MKFIDLLLRAWNNLWENKGRTILTVLSASIGVLSIVVMGSIGGELKEGILGNYIDKNELYKIGIWESSEYSIDLDLLKSFKGIKSLSTAKVYSGDIKYKGNTISGKIVLIDKKTLENMESYLQYGESIKDINGAIVSKRLNEEYGLLNDNCRIKGTDNDTIDISLRVDGVLSTDKPFLYDNINLNIDGLYPLIIYFPIERVEMEENYEGDEGLKIHYLKFEDSKDLNNIIKYLNDNNYSYDSAYERANVINNIFLIIQIILGLLGSITLIISAITVSNTMSMAIIERQKEIGVLKAIGMRVSDIRKIFILEALYIAIIGGLGGMILSFLVSEIINKVFSNNIPQEAFNISKIINISPTIVLLIFIFTIVVIIISVLSSIRRAVKIDVLATLREE